MKCVYCEEEIPNDSNYCEFCGEPVVVYDVYEPPTIKIPYTLRELPENILQFLYHDKLSDAIKESMALYELNYETSCGYMNKMYIEVLLKRGNKLQAIKHYCKLYNVGFFDGKKAIDDLENKFK